MGAGFIFGAIIITFLLVILGVGIMGRLAGFSDPTSPSTGNPPRFIEWKELPMMPMTAVSTSVRNILLSLSRSPSSDLGDEPVVALAPVITGDVESSGSRAKPKSPLHPVKKPAPKRERKLSVDEAPQSPVTPRSRKKTAGGSSAVTVDDHGPAHPPRPARMAAVSQTSQMSEGKKYRNTTATAARKKAAKEPVKPWEKSKKGTAEGAPPKMTGKSWDRVPKN